MERQPLLDSSRNESYPVPSIAPTVASNNLLACLVCGSMIDISDKKEQHVVKCNNCNEATPLREAPPGRRFVRCPCNCLLVCNVTATRISCPRPQCRRIILVSPDSPINQLDNGRNLVDSNVEHGTTPQYSRVSCAHCKQNFIFTDDNYLARCPHCRKLSTTNPRFTRTRGTIYLVLAVLALAVTLGVTFGTLTSVNHGYKGYIVLDVLFSLLTLFLLYRSGSYFFMSVSLRSS